MMTMEKLLKEWTDEVLRYDQAIVLFESHLGYVRGLRLGRPEAIAHQRYIYQIKGWRAQLKALLAKYAPKPTEEAPADAQGS